MHICRVDYRGWDRASNRVALGRPNTRRIYNEEEIGGGTRRYYTKSSVYSLRLGPFWREPVSLRVCIRGRPKPLRGARARKGNETALCLWSRVYGMAEGWRSNSSGSLWSDYLWTNYIPNRSPPATITNIVSRLRSRLQVCARVCVRGYTQSNYPFTGMKFSLMRFNCTSTIELLSELGTVSSLELRVEIQKVWKYRYVSSKNSRRNQWIS